MSSLLGNPQTLDLVVRAWKSGKRPRNKFEAYHFGIENLLTETNTAYQLRGIDIVRLADIRRAAGSACATLLVSNGIAIARTEVGPEDDGGVYGEGKYGECRSPTVQEQLAGAGKDGSPGIEKREA